MTKENMLKVMAAHSYMDDRQRRLAVSTAMRLNSKTETEAMYRMFRERALTADTCLRALATPRRMRDRAQHTTPRTQMSTNNIRRTWERKTRPQGSR